MRRKAIRVALTVAIWAMVAACAPSPPPDPWRGELIDLSHTYDQTTIYWPTSETFRLDVVSRGQTPGGYYYAANNVFTAEHGGTHVDAPIHFAEGAETVDRVPLRRLIGPGVVIDVTTSADASPDYLVTVADLQQAEQRDGTIQDGAIVLLRTGFSRRWPDAQRYLGTSARGAEAVAQLHFPGLHPDAAAWLLANRRIAAIGIDTASIDYGQSTAFQAHRTLAASNVPVFENLTSLDRLPARGATVIALPMKIGGGSGAPLRAIALLPAAAAQ